MPKAVFQNSQSNLIIWANVSQKVQVTPRCRNIAGNPVSGWYTFTPLFTGWAAISPGPICIITQQPVTSACLQEFDQRMLIFIRKLYSKVVPLIFKEIRAETFTTVGIKTCKLSNRSSSGKRDYTRWSRQLY